MAVQTHSAPNDANSRSLKDISDATTLGSATPDMRCPDPSAHKTKNTTLQDHASAAALYSTNSAKGAGRKEANPLGQDGRLSSSSAATSLRHARAHELPSFPIVGIDTQSSAGAAANLANNNTKSPEWWKPEQSAAAGKAALLANDYKMAPLWQPEASAAGSKAALLAHKAGANLNLWTPEASAEGNSAANIAMRKQGLTPKIDYGHTEDSRRKALLAATGAVSSSGRKRAQSSPAPRPTYPDSENSARNALNAATIAHTPSMRAKPTPSSPLVSESDRLGSAAMEAARIKHSKSISRDMYTERPPVALEMEERKRQDALRASAISMAKKMYDVQQNNADQQAAAASASKSATANQGLRSEDDIKQQAMRYIGIQEAAQKLANERLAKIGYDENAAYRSYYGYDKPNRAKLSIRRGRNRSSSNPETADSDDDELQSQRIRSQMTMFNKSLADVDAKKREQDRGYLLAAAQRKVRAQMQGMDQKIFDETGKMSPAMVDDWDAKARAKAAAASEARMENHGKVHIGHGKYMDQADIDAVALARIQPTLDEIAEKTEKRRAEEEERRLELEEKKREDQRDKQRAAEIRAEEKRYKDEEKKAAKARNAEEKAAARQEKQAEKDKKAEEKRLARENKRKSKEIPKGTAVTPADATSPTAEDTTAMEDREQDSHDSLYQEPTPAGQVEQQPELEAAAPASPTSPTSPTSPKQESKGIKSFLNKFKRRSKHSSETADVDQPGFIGGASLRQSQSHSQSHSAHASTPSSPQAGPTHVIGAERRHSDVSSISTNIAPPSDRGRSPRRTASGASAVSSVASAEFEEARDEFDEKLAPPPSFTSDASGRKGSPNRDSRFHEVGI